MLRPLAEAVSVIGTARMMRVGIAANASAVPSEATPEVTMTSPRSLTAWRRTARHLPSLLVLALVLGVVVSLATHKPSERIDREFDEARELAAGR